MTRSANTRADPCRDRQPAIPRPGTFGSGLRGCDCETGAIGCPELAPLISFMLDGKLDRNSWRKSNGICKAVRCNASAAISARSRRLYAAIPLLHPPAGWCYATTIGAGSAEAISLAATATSACLRRFHSSGQGRPGACRRVPSVGSLVSGKAAAIVAAAGLAIAATMARPWPGRPAVDRERRW